MSKVAPMGLTMFFPKSMQSRASLVTRNGVGGDEFPIILPGLHAFADLIVGNIGC